MLGLSDAQWISIAVVSGFVGVIVQMQAWERRLAKQLFALLDRERFQEQTRLEREWTQSQKEIKRARRAAFFGASSRIKNRSRRLSPTRRARVADRGKRGALRHR